MVFQQENLREKVTKVLSVKGKLLNQTEKLCQITIPVLRLEILL